MECDECTNGVTTWHHPACIYNSIKCNPEDCISIPCVEPHMKTNNYTIEDIIEDIIERRAYEYRNQTHTYQPNPQPHRLQRMHQGVYGLPIPTPIRDQQADAVNLDQSYDIPPPVEDQLC